MLRLLWRLTRQLFHETTGALFIFFALVGAIGAVREWTNPTQHWVAWLAGGYAALMGVFGVNAFRDSRRVR